MEECMRFNISKLIMVASLSCMVMLFGSCELFQNNEVDFTTLKPVLISPPDQTVFGHYPRSTTLAWQIVENATSYLIHVEYTWAGDFEQFGIWNEGDYGLAYINETSTTADIFHFIGAQPGRWRIKAKKNSDESSWSDWWYFRYTQ
jgi:hypothetical protein